MNLQSQMRTRGEGVQNPENFADVIYGRPLTTDMEKRAECPIPGCAAVSLFPPLSVLHRLVYCVLTIDLI